MSQDYIISEESGAVSFCPLRNLDEAIGRNLRGDIIRFMTSGRRKFIIDLTKSDLLPSLGIGILASLNATFSSKDARFVIININPNIAKTLRITRMDEILEMVGSKEAAVDALARMESA